MSMHLIFEGHALISDKCLTTHQYGNHKWNELEFANDAAIIVSREKNIHVHTIGNVVLVLHSCRGRSETSLLKPYKWSMNY